MLLSPAKWTISLNLLGLNAKSEEDMIHDRLLNWLHEKKAPSTLYLALFDHRILLNLENRLHVDEIIHELKQKETITLVQPVRLEENQWSRSKRGVHLPEFVFTFLKDSQYRRNVNSPLQLNFDRGSSNDCVKLPGSEWLYLKLYLNRENEAEFISKRLAPFSQLVLEQKNAEDWFYIRYSEHDSSHLRLRYRGDPTLLREKLLPQIHQWTSQLIGEQLIHQIEICGYEPEYGRYGGGELIGLAEAIFAIDSKVVAKVLELIENQQIKLPIHIVAAVGIISAH